MTADGLVPLGDLTEAEQEILVRYRAMPSEYRPAVHRFIFRLANDYPTAKAEALFWREVAAAGWRGN